MVFFTISHYRTDTFIQFFKISSYNTMQQIWQDLVSWMLSWKLVLVAGVSYCCKKLVWQLLKAHCYSNSLTFPEKKYFWFLQQCEILPNIIFFFKWIVKKKPNTSPTPKTSNNPRSRIASEMFWKFIRCKIPEDKTLFFLILFFFRVVDYFQFLPFKTSELYSEEKRS